MPNFNYVLKYKPNILIITIIIIIHFSNLLNLKFWSQVENFYSFFLF